MMKTRWLAMLVALASACVIHACSDFSASDGGESSDAAVEASTGDGATDGAGADVDAAPQRFCASDSGTLCEDWDDPGAAIFGTPSLDVGGSFEVVSDVSVSPPNSAHFAMARPPDDSCHGSSVERSNLTIPAPNGFYLEYELRLEDSLATDTFVGGYVSYQQTSSYCRFYLSVSSANAQLHIEPDDANTPAQKVDLDRRPVVGQWSHVEIDVHGGVGARKVSVFIDGKAAASDVAVDAPCNSGTSILQLYAGLVCLTQANGDVSIGVDDVRLQAR